MQLRGTESILPGEFSFPSVSFAASDIGSDRAPRRLLSTGMETGRTCRLRVVLLRTPSWSLVASETESLISTISWKPTLLFFLPLAGALAVRRRILSPIDRFRIWWELLFSEDPCLGFLLNSPFRPWSCLFWGQKKDQPQIKPMTPWEQLEFEMAAPWRMSVEWNLQPLPGGRSEWENSSQ